MQLVVFIFSLQVYTLTLTKTHPRVGSGRRGFISLVSAHAMSLLNIEIKFENELFHHYR